MTDNNSGEIDRLKPVHLTLTTGEAEYLAQQVLPPTKSKVKKRAKTVRNSEGKKIPVGKLDIPLTDSVVAMEEQMERSRIRREARDIKSQEAGEA